MFAATVLALVTTAPPLPSLVIEQYQLANELTVILNPDPKEPLVAVNVRYRTGSMDDPEGRAGLAHLVEHIMFLDRGESPSGNAFFARLESAGATRINAFTTFDHTEYQELVPPEALEMTLWLEAERMTRLSDWAPAERVEREKAIVANELFERVHDQPYAFTQQLIFERMFPKGHPLHHTPIGTIDQIEASSAADVVLFHSSYYAPRAATLVIAGGFELDAAKRMVEAYFGPLKNVAPKPQQRLMAAPQFPPKAINGPEWIASRPLLSMYWKGPGMRSSAARSLEVFGMMLSHGALSRAALANMRDESIEGLSAGLLHTPAGNIFALNAVATAGVLPQLARHRVQAIIETYVDFAPMKEELEGTKKRLRLDFLRQMASLPDRAAMLQQANAAFDRGEIALGLPAAWEKVTALGIQEALNKHIIGDPLFAVAHPIRR